MDNYIHFFIDEKDCIWYGTKIKTVNVYFTQLLSSHRPIPFQFHLDNKFVIFWLLEFAILFVVIWVLANGRGLAHKLHSQKEILYFL